MLSNICRGGDRRAERISLPTAAEDTRELPE
jgi:hypothetical protein